MKEIHQTTTNLQTETKNINTNKEEFDCLDWALTQELQPFEVTQC